MFFELDYYLKWEQTAIYVYCASYKIFQHFNFCHIRGRKIFKQWPTMLIILMFKPYTQPHTVTEMHESKKE